MSIPRQSPQDLVTLAWRREYVAAVPHGLDQNGDLWRGVDLTAQPHDLYVIVPAWAILNAATVSMGPLGILHVEDFKYAPAGGAAVQ
jgi:hypothetical protein